MKLAVGCPVIDLISIAFRANRPVLLEGPHGIGKSSLFDAAALELGIDVIVRDLSLMEPPDLTGLPRITDGVTTFAPPSFLPRDGKGLLVFEELNRCPRYMRASCLELLTARRLNDYTLPNGWVPMAAINPACDGYIDADELDLALLSRFLRIEVTPSVEEWCRWARNNGVHEKIIEFVEQSPGSLEQASPRSWTYASDLLTTWEAADDRDDEVLAAALAGTLGDNWALAFTRYYSDAECTPLTARDIIDNYQVLRAAVKRWVAGGKLDLVAASLESLKRYLQPQRNYDDVIEHAEQKENIQTFFGDLPADLKRQLSNWLQERGFTKLSVPRKPKK